MKELKNICRHKILISLKLLADSISSNSQDPAQINYITKQSYLNEKYLNDLINPKMCQNI